MLSAAPSRGQNLLKNPGFEESGGWTAYMLAALQNQWRSHDGGHYNAAILGLWADKEVGGIIDRTQWADRAPNGLIEQRGLPVQAGRRYTFQAWLWADPGWRPRQQFMKITFYDEKGFIIGDSSLELTALSSDWTHERLSAEAPAGAATAAISIGARGVSAYGALTIDDTFFGED
jgi:hypothetical protein